MDHETLRRCLIAEGLWKVQRGRPKPRRWRPRSASPTAPPPRRRSEGTFPTSPRWGHSYRVSTLFAYKRRGEGVPSDRSLIQLRGPSWCRKSELRPRDFVAAAAPAATAGRGRTGHPCSPRSLTQVLKSALMLDLGSGSLSFQPWASDRVCIFSHLRRPILVASRGRPKFRG